VPHPRPWSSATLLAAVFVALVLYASLFPFQGWRWPPGQDLPALLTLPPSPYHSTFDLYTNFIGYLPVGFLVALAARRSLLRTRTALLLALATGLGLSYLCECLQQFVPGRVPSLEDFKMNSAGATSGALLALAVHIFGWVDRWQAFRARWFSGDAAFALVLLSLWPVALLFPTPVPLGLGQVGQRLREGLSESLADVPWASSVQQVLAAPAANTVGGLALHPIMEILLIALGLLAPCMVAYSVAAPGWRRLVLAVGSLGLAVAAMALSTLLNFGPLHMMSWVTPQTVQGLGLGMLVALLLLPLGRYPAAGVGLVALTGLVFGVAQAPDDPYFAQSLQAWEQGQFVRFHGLAQWVGWLWPYAAMVWLLMRLGKRRGAGS
jgi:VanZ family protein